MNSTFSRNRHTIISSLSSCFSFYKLKNLFSFYFFVLFLAPSVLEAQTCSGNVTGVLSVYEVASPNNCVGAVNSTGTRIKTNGFITLDLSNTLATGATYSITWTTFVVSSASVKVEESPDGVNFTAASGSPFTVAGTSYSTLNITTSAHTRYLRISKLSGVDVYVDAVTYTNQTCISLSASLTCTASATQISGHVFRDFDYDGVYGAADYLGIKDVVVTAYNVAGTAFTGTTDATGLYTISGLTATTTYRLEFNYSSLGSWASTTGKGTNNGTSVQFVQSGNCANLGLANPTDYCQADPVVVTPCYINGDPMLSGTAASADVFVGLQKSTIASAYDVATTALPHTLLATGVQMGAVWGVAYQRSTGLIFTSAFTKRHMGFGSLGTGGIYTINPTTSTVTPWLDVQTQSGVSTGSNPHTGLPADLTTPNNDPNAVDAVGKISIGDLDISEDGKTLYAVNLAGRELLIIDIATKTLTSRIAIPDPSCSSSSDNRPFGLGIKDGVVYLGTVCSGESTGNLSDVQGFILKLNGTSFTTVVSFPIQATRTTDCAGGGCDWQPWTSSFNSTGVFSSLILLPQPIIADIEFDANGSLIVGLMDRWGHIAGWQNYGPTGTTAISGLSSGDIVRICRNSDGSYSYQGNAGCPLSQNSETYFDGGAHLESSFGGLLSLPSARELIFPAVGIKGGGRGGIRRSDNTNGGYLAEGLVYNNVGLGPNTGKADGLGDIEALCSQAPIEIGNRVWTDTDRDGIQDAGESGINGLTVDLYEGSTKVGTTTTDANGEYYFNNTNVNLNGVSGLKPDSSYQIRIAKTQAAITSLEVTTSNINSNGSDMIDNDAVLSGTNAVVDVTIGGAGQNNHTLDFGFRTPQCAIIVTPSVSGCYQSGGQSKATVSVEVAWENAPSGDSIAVTLGAQTRYIKPGTQSVDYGFGIIGNQTIVSPQVVAFEIDANGTAGSISAAFTTNSSCSDTENYTAPAACPPTTCSGNQTGGTVFSDYNADGIKNVGETNGLSSVTVKAYDCNGSIVSTTTTDAYGKYSFSGLTAGSYPIRVEFSGLPSVYGNGTTKGTNGKTTTQFVASANCNIDLGVLDPNDYCQTNPTLYIPCYVSGDPLVAGTAASMDANVSVPYSYSGVPGQAGYTSPTHIATAAEVGSLWGTTYNANTKRLFQSATLHRHVGLGPQGIGGIYVTNLTTPATPSVGNFINVITDLGIDVVDPLNPVPSNSARGLTGDKTAPSNDSLSIAYIGRTGIGGLDLSTDGNDLWFVNMYDKKLYKIDISAYNSDGTTKPTAANKTAYTIPDPNCTGGTARPYAVKIYKGEAYVGVVCDGSTSQNKSDLRAYVYKLSGSTWTTVFDFPLTYPKGPAVVPNIPQITGWYPWTDNWNTMTTIVRDRGSNKLDWTYPTPLLSDIEFDIDGSMILALMDRTGMMSGNENYRPIGTTYSYSNNSGGDVLKAYYSGNTYILENAAKAGPYTGASPTNSQGPGFGEFYDESLVWTYNGGSPSLEHTETALGGLALRPGSGETIITAFDPENVATPANFYPNPFNIGGFIKGNNTTGAKNSGYAVFQGGISGGVFAKAASLGDVDIACSTPQYLQVGNYVWLDTDKDGVQDPCEAPISNVTVTLWKGGTQIASISTDANGEYYFSDKNAAGVTWTGTGADTTLLPSMAYEVRIDTSNQATFIKLALTTANSTANNGNDQNDNDATTTGNYKVISFTTGVVGSVNHTLDFGFYPFCDTTLVVKDTTICNGSSVDLFTLASGVKGTLSYSTNGTTWTALTSPTNVTPSLTTTYYIKDTLVIGCFDIDTLVITVNPEPTAPSVSSPIMNVCPTTTVNLTTIASALTPSVSGGVFEWHVSNSSSSALVSNQNTVVAGDYYLFERSPAGCYSVGLKVTVTIQVCCPPKICLPVAVTRN